MISLTTQERKTVSTGRKVPRPSYYSAQNKQNVEISEDFEAFLILVGSKKRHEAAKWISDIGDLAGSNDDRDGLLKEWLDNEQTTVDAVVDELETDLAAFDTWRKEFINDDPRFAAIPEVQQLIRDLQSQAESLFSTQRRMIHRAILLGQTETRLFNGGLRAGQMQQTISWVTPLTSYK